MKFIFTNYAKKQLRRLDNTTQRRITEKLLFLKQNTALLEQNLKSVVGLQPITHRLRIGSYRILLTADDKNYIVVKIGHRREIY